MVAAGFESWNEDGLEDETELEQGNVRTEDAWGKERRVSQLHLCAKRVRGKIRVSAAGAQ